jgi:succinate-semialdehyde dehydrogenase/glutarate-semialdehyde dehydrogenase
VKELDRVLDTSATLTSYNPATGEALGTVPLMGPDEVAQSIATARQAFQVWKKLGFGGRKTHLMRFRQALVDARDEVAELLTRENGKPLVEALTEILSACEFLAYYAANAETMLQDESIHVLNPVVANKETFLAFEPKGVIAIISPWNYPLLLTIAEASGALAAGNAVIIKPSELTPLLMLKIGEIAQRAGMPEGVLQIITGDGTTGAALSTSKVDRVCFTGSVATGKKVAKAAIEHLVPVTLELGGKDPALVLPDVDLDFTAQGLVWGAFTNAGQACASVERAYLHSRVAFTLTEKIVERTKALVVGDGHDPNTEVGPIISEAQLRRIEAQVEDAVANGAKVLCGGQRLPGPGLFYAPTVLTDVTPDMLVLQEETFGPLLPLITCSDEDEMIDLANDSPFGLSATIWTRDVEHGKALAREVQAGSVWVNTGLASYGNPLTPRGGFKESGIGKIGGKHGLLEMVNIKLIDVADHGKVKDWWFPTWGGAYQYFSAGIELLHGGSLGRKAEGLLQFLRTRR